MEGHSGNVHPLKKVYRFLELNTTAYQRVYVNHIFQDVCDLGLRCPLGGSEGNTDTFF